MMSGWLLQAVRVDNALELDDAPVRSDVLDAVEEGEEVAETATTATTGGIALTATAGFHHNIRDTRCVNKGRGARRREKAAKTRCRHCKR